MEDSLKASLNIFRRLPPSEVQNTLQGVVDLVPEYADDLFQRIDQPLEVARDPKTEQQYLLCDYNRDGDSHRSPWSNEYYPPIENGFLPSKNLRELEQKANILFDAYRELYFDGGLSSVYLWDMNGQDHFAGCVLIKKDIENGSAQIKSGSWNSIHVFEILPSKSELGKAHYKLTTTIILEFQVENQEVGNATQCGQLSKQSQSVLSYANEDSHLSNIGQMIEEIENQLRSDFDILYLSRSQQIINSIRTLQEKQANQMNLIAEFQKRLAAKNNQNNNNNTNTSNENQDKKDSIDQNNS
ncbi:hypothetical protein WA158_002805 [Blastocystis sp. Blastoise]